ncbi:PD-(D/E)XK motif protein [uncultured Tateyamaria sp.]|uniref:PD-(D/E)XK motif protein n=1 Tax=uncultured Tateyamaria sp. TaxID=455651 RepID=UPI002630F11D|nr:PD-(D/E)XK motif protein [uncultured Tateyamaria sp.]
MIEDPWNTIQISEARRVDSQGKHDFFWVRMPDKSVGLLLRLSDETSEIRPLPKLKHVDVSYQLVDEQNCYCVTLGESTHVDLFETLCRDVVKAAEEAPDLQSALARAVRRTLRWHHLLRGGRNQGMSLEEQRGLVAELAFLRELVHHLGALKAVEAWKGPDESAKDFELPGKFFEIKARRSAAHPKVRISSEAQLMDIDGADLFLRVQDVDTSLASEGENLIDHVEQTERLFDGDIMALDLWEQRLATIGYSPEQVEQERRWHLGTNRTFEVLDGFPRLIPPMPQGVDGVEYTIRLDACSEFERNFALDILLNKEAADV